LTLGATDNTAADNAAMSVGFTDGTRSRCGTWISEHGQDTSDSTSTVDTDSCIYLYNAVGSEECNAVFSAWIDDGVQITWTNAPASGLLLTVVLFGGTDLADAYVNHFASNASIDTATDVTDPGFKPTDLLLAAGLPYSTYFNLSVGAVHNTADDVVTQRFTTHVDRDNQDTIQVGSHVSNTYGAGIISVVSTEYWMGEFGSFDANGFSCTTRDSTTGSGINIAYLALRITTYDSYIGTLDTPVDVGNDGQTGVGFKPQFVMQVTSGCTTINANNTANTGGNLGISVADATAQYSNQIASEDAVGTTNTESQSDDQMVVLHDDDGAALFATSFVSFDADGFTQNFTATGGTAAYWWFWAVEEEEAGGETYEQAVSGAITPSGVIVNSARKVVSGALTSSGVLVNSARKVLAGAFTPDGALAKRAGKPLTGAITPAGVVAAVKTALVSLAGELTSAGGLVLRAGKSLAGALTPDGGLVRSARKVLAGAITPDGALAKMTGKLLAGSLTPSGIVGTVKAALVSLGGSLTPAGELVRQTAKGLAGAITPAGEVVRSVAKILAGALTSAGGLATQLISGVIQQAVGGVLTPTGELVRQTNKSLAGALASAGTVAKRVAISMAGVLSSAGALIASAGGVLGRVAATLGLVGGASGTESVVGGASATEAGVGDVTGTEE